MIIDAHVHLLGLREARGCIISTKLMRGPLYPLLTRALGLTGIARDRLDDAYADRLQAWVNLSELDAIGLLAFDGVYTERGDFDRERTHFMVGNDYCLEVAGRSSKFLPICSVNPRRKDAIEELERVVAAGAVAIKTLPNSQGFDPADRAFTRFWQRMADLKIPLLTHTSFEHTIPPIDQLYGRPERLHPVLEQGVTVIAAHCAGSGVAHPLHEDFDTWHEMLRDHSNLYGDISAMASVSRFPYIHRVLRSDLALERVILGSDLPVPVSPSVFLKPLGVRKVRELQKLATNPIQQNLETFRALGVPAEVFERGATLLRGVQP